MDNDKVKLLIKGVLESLPIHDYSDNRMNYLRCPFCEEYTPMNGSEGRMKNIDHEGDCPFKIATELSALANFC